MSTADLERLFTTEWADPGVRRDLGWALFHDALEVCSITRSQVRVITSERQREVCDRAARRIVSLDTGDRELIGRATTLLAEIADGSQWRWHPRTTATGLAVATTVAGLAGVGVAAASELPGAAALAALVTSLLLAVLVVRYRRESWRIRAEGLRATVWRQGI